jgi:hypothetical protein
MSVNIYGSSYGLGWGYISTHFVPFVDDQLQDAARRQMKNLDHDFFDND